jgi:hypothetical protein
MSLMDTVVHMIRKQGGRGSLDTLYPVLREHGYSKMQVSKAIERCRVAGRLVLDGPRRVSKAGSQATALPGIHRLGPNEPDSIERPPVLKPPASIFETASPEMVACWPIPIGRATTFRPMGDWKAEDEEMTA